MLAPPLRPWPKLWPRPEHGHVQAMQAEGKIRALGVSNFGLGDLKHLLTLGGPPPATLQNKFSPYHAGSAHVNGDDYLSFCLEQGIVTAWRGK